MKSVNSMIAGVMLSVVTQNIALALEVDREVMPRITLGGRIITTVDVPDYDTDQGAEEEINLEDSSLLISFDKRLYRDGVAGAVVGIKEHDEQVAFQQMHAFYWDQDMNVQVGRSRLRNTLLELPLLRDDDFLSYTHVGNGSSNEEFDQTYGDYVAVDWVVDKKIQKLGVWAGSRRIEAGISAPEGFNSYGLGYVYEQSEDLWYVKNIRHAGVLIDSQKVDVAGVEETVNAIIAGVEINLNLNPQSSWSMALQTIVNNGIDSIVAADIVNGNIDAVSNRARASSTSVVASIRFTNRPHLLTRMQTALNVGYKDYSDIDNASQYSIAPSLVYRLGQGVDLLAQLKYTDFDDGLGGGSDTAIQVGMAFSLEAVFNDNLGEGRESILNLEHGYIQ